MVLPGWSYSVRLSSIFLLILKTIHAGVVGPSVSPLCRQAHTPLMPADRGQLALSSLPKGGPTPDPGSSPSNAYDELHSGDWKC